MKRACMVAGCLLLLPLLSACAGKSFLTKSASSATSAAASDYPTVERPVAGCAAGKNEFDCDRRAILAMLGNYQVKFNFDETVVLKPGYARKDPKRSAAFEHVLLVEDTGKRISLQHVLIMGGGTITKHWRQDWVYESPRHWSYVGNQRVEQREREAATVPGTWTQLVYEVNDAPRYSGSGKWNHRYGISTWTSERGWRPLPRREYTKRDDYQLINGENRHTITPQGWTHEQDNTKVIRTEDGKDVVLVREFGFNEYRRIDGYDFKPASDYWKSTSDFWADIRARWERALAKDGSVTLSLRTGDEDFNKAILETADAYGKNPRLDEYRTKVDELFHKYVNVEPLGSKTKHSDSSAP
jgi:hypothetical protein